MKYPRFVVVVFSLVVISVFCFSACGSSSDNISQNIVDPSNTVVNGNVQSDDAVLTIHGILEGKSEDQLFQQSSLLITGTVSKSHSFQIQKPTGETSNFTDYEIDVSEILRGELKGHRVTVRIQGGTAGGISEVYSPGPELKLSEEYLLFLYKPARGGGFNTEGDYYYILGLTQGIFQIVSNSYETAEATVYKSQSGHEISYTRIVERATEYPIDEFYFRTEYIENQKRNLKNGFITNDEYDKIMANIDVYAKVLDD